MCLKLNLLKTTKPIPKHRTQTMNPIHHSKTILHYCQNRRTKYAKRQTTITLTVKETTYANHDQTLNNSVKETKPNLLIQSMISHKKATFQFYLNRFCIIAKISKSQTEKE